MTKFSRAFEKGIFKRDKGICLICGRIAEFDDGQIDHIKPSSKGGSDEPENLQWTCHRCNLLKGNRLTNEQVRKILRLPEKFEDILKLQSQSKTIEELPKEKISDKLPVFSQDGLDEQVLTKCVSVFLETYQNETIIPDICDKISSVEEISNDFTNIHVHLRMPREFFMPYEATHRVFFNDPMFSDFGREIAFNERKYIQNTILKNEEINRIDVDFSPNGILEAIDKMKSKGMPPNMITIPLDFWGKMHFWTEEANIRYDNVNTLSNLKASLVLKNTELKIVHPLGDFPVVPILFSNKAITWIVRKYPNQCAAYIVLGNNQLFPLKYVEVLAGTVVNNKLIPDGISTLSFPKQ